MTTLRDRDSQGDRPPWEFAWAHRQFSWRARVNRLRTKSWHIGQASIAAGVAWFLAHDVLGHPQPFFAPIAALVCLGTSYGQRLRRVAEVTLGVAIGVLMADLLVQWVGSGWWQLTVIVALAMITALLLDAGGLFVTQAAVQSIVIVTLVPQPGQALLRWTDALIGGGVALIAATVVPRAPLRRPREQAAVVLAKISELLRGAADAMEDGDVECTLALLKDARTTDALVAELQLAADEGLSVVRSSPFRYRHRGRVRRVSELVEPLDLALRNTRVIVRRAAIAAYRREPVPQGYARLMRDVAEAVDAIAEELRAERTPTAVRDRLIGLGEATVHMERGVGLSGEVILAQLRSVIADLLRLTGLDGLESSDAIPPLSQN